MYTIRVDTRRQTVCVEATGRVVTAEALRGVSQVLALAEAGNISRVECDVTGLERGPGGLLLLAAAIASGRRADTRIAFVVGARQEPLVRRLVRFGGLHGAAELFSNRSMARAWLNPGSFPVLGETERRHVAELLGVEPRSGAGRQRVGTAPHKPAA